MTTDEPRPWEPLICGLDPADAHQSDLVAEITALVNDVYNVAEAGLWQPGLRRTTAAEISDAIGAGQLIGASLDDRIAGVVQTSVTGGVGRFGMLAVLPQCRGLGIGLARI